MTTLHCPPTKTNWHASNQWKQKLKVIVKWPKDSGLKVNKSKTEICLFYHKDTPQVEISVSGIKVKSKDHMNVLGVTFDN